MTLTASELKPGYDLPSVSRELSVEEIISFTRKERALWGLPEGGKSIHNDEEYARSFGIRGVVAPGIMTMPLIWGLLLDSFGESWLRGGRLAVTFTNMVCGGDRVTARAVVREPAKGEPADRLHLDTWMENQQGEKVIVGKASVSLS